MNIAVILAGGCGKRTGQDIPKQFLNVEDKPIIIYTLEAFDKHPNIDGIIVSCVDGWDEILWAYAREFNIKKLKWVVIGGNNVQESIEKALDGLSGRCHGDDILLIHDAIRPMVSQDTISDCIVKCKEYGSGLAAVRCQETIVRTEDAIKGNHSIDRSEVMRVQTPQAYRYGRVRWALEEAKRRNIVDEVYINTLMIHVGEMVYFAMGSNKNIKITTAEDIEIFTALYNTKQESWVKSE
ncbi:MAG TPA: 2-C-methyl-D-erythritol 4-phosphate cytidylyltransferase [Clostridiales bacterium]|nr:2-C-methyl-D-erythritol 4-phosphate cytidylyltransferase [Clostridiales bacterium]